MAPVRIISAWRAHGVRTMRIPCAWHVRTSVVHLQFSGAVLQNCNRRKTALWEMRGLSSQFFQTAELRRIQGPRKLQNRELRMSGFRGNCETATKPRNLLQNCRNAEKLRISADICRNLLYFRDCRTAELQILRFRQKP
jgi:hypothetical protein